MKYDRVNENGSIAAHCFVQWNGAFTVERNGLHSAVKLSPWKWFDSDNGIFFLLSLSLSLSLSLFFGEKQKPWHRSYLINIYPIYIFFFRHKFPTLYTSATFEFSMLEKKKGRNKSMKQQRTRVLSIRDTFFPPPPLPKFSSICKVAERSKLSEASFCSLTGFTYSIRIRESNYRGTFSRNNEQQMFRLFSLGRVRSCLAQKSATEKKERKRRVCRIYNLPRRPRWNFLS